MHTTRHLSAHCLDPVEDLPSGIHGVLTTVTSRNLQLHSQVEGDLASAFVPERRQEELQTPLIKSEVWNPGRPRKYLVKELLSMLGVVHQAYRYLLFIMDCIPNSIDISWICLFALQEATVAAFNLFATVLGKRTEGFAAVDNGVISHIGISENPGCIACFFEHINDQLIFDRQFFIFLKVSVLTNSAFRK